MELLSTDPPDRLELGILNMKRQNVDATIELMFRHPMIAREAQILDNLTPG
ncbi:MAG: hypothetical protein ACI9TB_001005 [Parasphingorhabdus sp.]|jgi:hypothetical protein